MTHPLASIEGDHELLQGRCLGHYLAIMEDGEADARAVLVAGPGCVPADGEVTSMEPQVVDREIPAWA